jgi:hypothetical protein
VPVAADKIVSVLKASGPLTGGELAERTLIDLFTLWRTSRTSPRLRFRIIGRRFLRLDRNVEGYARLSPSIGREFQTYTVVGAAEDSSLVAAAGKLREEEIAAISREKLALSRETIAAVLEALPEREEIIERGCFILAGDIVYSMAHRAPRPERSTGKPVRGSDLDIVAVTEDGLHPEAVAALDRAIYDRKHWLMVHPRYREEIDYLIKPLSRVRRQLQFDTFERMVAAKILHEGQLLAGSPRVFGAVKKMLEEKGIPAQIADLTDRARLTRQKAEARLLGLASELEAGEDRDLFRTREESLEGIY